MRLVTFESAGRAPAVGALVRDDRHIVDLARACPGDAAFHSMQGLIEAGPAALDKARDAADAAARSGGHLHATAECRLLAPVPVPVQMRDFGCFSEHFRNCRETRLRRRAASAPDPQKAYEAAVAAGGLKLPADFMERPRFYTCNRLSVVGHGTVVPWPEMTEQLDFELEFGVFIGTPARDVPEEHAHRHIFGYTLFNDLTMRDVQEAEERTGGKNKDFDSGNVMGPCIVTADEIPDPYALRAFARVNGETWCDNTTATMDRTFAQIIAYMSRSQTLHAGEFLASGTVGGGCGLERDRYLNPGDRIDIGMERIGTLSITIGQREGGRP